MIEFELILCYLLLFLAAGTDCLFRAPALLSSDVKPKNPSGINILRDSPSLSDPLYRADYEGGLLEMGGITNLMIKHFKMVYFEATFGGRGLFWTHAMILAFAFAVFKAIDLMLALFLPNAENKLVVAFWSIVAIASNDSYCTQEF